MRNFRIRLSLYLGKFLIELPDIYALCSQSRHRQRNKCE